MNQIKVIAYYRKLQKMVLLLLNPLNKVSMGTDQIALMTDVYIFEMYMYMQVVWNQYFYN